MYAWRMYFEGTSAYRRQAVGQNNCWFSALSIFQTGCVTFKTLEWDCPRSANAWWRLPLPVLHHAGYCHFDELLIRDYIVSCGHRVSDHQFLGKRLTPMLVVYVQATERYHCGLGIETRLVDGVPLTLLDYQTANTVINTVRLQHCAKRWRGVSFIGRCWYSLINKWGLSVQ